MRRGRRAPAARPVRAPTRRRPRTRARAASRRRGTSAAPSRRTCTSAGIEREERRRDRVVAVLRDVEEPLRVPVLERPEEQVAERAVCSVGGDVDAVQRRPEQRQRGPDPERDADRDERPERAPHAATLEGCAAAPAKDVGRGRTHPIGRRAVRPWRTATIVATLIAALELVVLVGVAVARAGEAAVAGGRAPGAGAGVHAGAEKAREAGIAGGRGGEAAALADHGSRPQRQRPDGTRRRRRRTACSAAATGSRAPATRPAATTRRASSCSARATAARRSASRATCT